jgi:acetylornithine deacetylase/succinyl-diaminopimelate desuccinylase-like protein
MKTQVDLDIAHIDKYVSDSRKSYEAQLKELVDIPTVSMDPECKKDIEKAAATAAKFLESIGAKAEIIKTKGNPVVVGHLEQGSQYPTVAIYNHLDVQPADAEEWKTKPFEMTIENGTYRGRGTTDDKGPALTVMYAAKYIKEQNIPVNIKFFWEFEEEIGSPHYEQFLKDHKSKLATNSVVISDTIWVSRERPAIQYGLRGLQGLMIKLKTGVKDVHSGLTGGLARNPIGELAQVISECYDARTGEVKIPGFYDDVRPLSDAELANFLKSGFSVDGFKKAHELHSLRTEDIKDAVQRIWARPTFEVHGIVGGYKGPGVKTIVPHDAEVKISMRLVPDQDPDKVLACVTKFIKEKCPDIEIIKEGTLRPFFSDPDNVFNKAAAESMKFAFGKDPAFNREGGSIGAVVSMHDELKVPIIFMGLSLPEHGYHAINENFDWQQASGGMKMFIKYFSLVSAMTK